MRQLSTEYPRSQRLTGKAAMGQLADAAVAGVYQTQAGRPERPQTSRRSGGKSVRGACADAGLDLGDIDGLIGDGPNGVGLRDGMPAAGRRRAARSPDPVLRQQQRRRGVDSGRAEPGRLRRLARAGRGGGDRQRGGGPGRGLRQRQPRRGGRGHGQAAAARTSTSTARPGSPTTPLWPCGTSTSTARRRSSWPRSRSRERHGATLHPLSVHGHRGDITVEDVVTSRLIADPLHLLDCCSVNQGGGAIVVTRPTTCGCHRAARAGGRCWATARGTATSTRTPSRA